MLAPLEIEQGLNVLAKTEFVSLGDEMREYQRRSSAGTVHPSAPYVILLTLDKSFNFALLAGETSPLNERVSRSLMSVAGAILKYVEKAECAYVDFDTVAVLVGDGSPHLLGEIDRINSLCASLATATLLNEYKELPFDRPVFRCQSFVLATSSVPAFFVWRQLEAWRKCVDACLWVAMGSNKDAVQEMHDIGSLDEKHEHYRKLTGKSVHDLDPWYRRGTVIRRGVVYKRNKADTAWLPGRKSWVVDATPPIFQRTLDYLQELLAGPLPFLVIAPNECPEAGAIVYFSLPDKTPTVYRKVPEEYLDEQNSPA